MAILVITDRRPRGGPEPHLFIIAAGIPALAAAAGLALSGMERRARLAASMP